MKEKLTLKGESTIYNYIDLIKDKFPGVSEKDIIKILNHGWTRYYRYNLFGGDVLLKSYNNNYWFYTGHLTKNSINWFNYYRFKLAKRIRMMYHKKKIKWDGFYYFAITEDEYNKYFKKRSGRKRVNFEFEQKKLYKIYEECRLKYMGTKGIVRFKHHTDIGMAPYRNKIKCKNVELILCREKPDTFNDLLMENLKINIYEERNN